KAIPTIRTNRQGVSAVTRSPLEAIMKRLTLLSAAIVSAALAIWPVRAEMDGRTARPAVHLELGAGSSLKLERPVSTVLIGNAEIIDGQRLDERSVRLKPLSSGATNLVFIDEQGMVITNLAIVVHDARAI